MKIKLLLTYQGETARPEGNDDDFPPPIITEENSDKSLLKIIEDILSGKPGDYISNW